MDDSQKVLYAVSVIGGFVYVGTSSDLLGSIGIGSFFILDKVFIVVNKAGVPAIVLPNTSEFSLCPIENVLGAYGSSIYLGVHNIIGVSAIRKESNLYKMYFEETKPKVRLS